MMFKQRNEPTEPRAPVEVRREPSVEKTDPPPPVAPRKSGSSVVGPSLLVQGDVSGEEDLVIQGRLEGSVNLNKNQVTVGKDGRVHATINAQSIRVEGTVEGELRGREQIIVTRTGSVHGNIVAPRVSLEDGCRFKGAIDMESPDGGGAGKVADIMLGAPMANDPGKKKN